MWKFLTLTLCLAAMPVLADETARFGIGSDVYQAGDTAVFEGAAGTADIFVAGQHVSVQSPISGAAHLAGSKVAVNAAVGSDLFVAGYDVAVAAPVAGDANLAGFEVSLSGGVGGNLRAGGNLVTVSGAVGGYALITAVSMVLNGVVSGDAVLATDRLTFGPEAKVAGLLTIYAADPAKIVVPQSVAPAARVKIEKRNIDSAPAWDHMNPVKISLWSVISSMIMGVVVTGLVALLVIALAPQRVVLWRAVAQAHPWRAVFSGFLVASTLAGSGIVLAMTIIGALLIPVVVLVVAVAVFAGYALGSFVLGCAIWQAVGRVLPVGLLGQFGITLLGAALVALGWFVPVLGWFFALGVTLLGIGTLAAMILPANLLLTRDQVARVAIG